MLVKEWLPEFIAEHQARYPDAGWPEAGSPSARGLWSKWLQGFIGGKVSKDEADEASRRMDTATIWCDEHPEVLVSIVEAMRREAARTSAVVASGDRDAAKLASRDCPRCSGEGMAEVFHPDFDGRRVVRPPMVVAGKEVKRPFAMVVAAHCNCPMGRWVRSRTDAELLKRTPDMCEVLAGRSTWVADDPMGERPFDPGLEDGGVVHVRDGRVVE